MRLKDKCTLCKKHTLGFLTKYVLILNIGFTCKNCRARYIPEKHILENKILFGYKFLTDIVDFILTFFWLPLIVLIVFFFMNSLIITFILCALLTILAFIFIRFRAYRLNENDPMNDRIKRIQNSKNNK